MPAVSISCDNVSATKDEKDSSKKEATNRENLIEVNRDGVKLRDPCQEPPQRTKPKRGKNR